eukprot:6213175-Pleurochrysis_carterae.AAC.8
MALGSSAIWFDAASRLRNLPCTADERGQSHCLAVLDTLRIGVESCLLTTLDESSSLVSDGCVGKSSLCVRACACVHVCVCVLVRVRMRVRACACASARARANGLGNPSRCQARTRVPAQTPRRAEEAAARHNLPSSPMVDGSAVRALFDTMRVVSAWSWLCETEPTHI